MADAAHVTGSESDAARPHEREQTSLRELIESLLVTIILALFGTTFVVQAFKIPSQSMEPTLLVGDHLLVNKFIFGGRDHWYDFVLPYRDVKRHDVIVFKFPYQDHPHYVKRVIGVPGDRIKIVDQHVFVNGQVQIEPFAYHDPAAPYDPFLYNFPPASRDELLPNMQPEWSDQIFNYIHDGEIVVPPGKYFAMGDNRDHSWDSRYWGFVDREAIMGRPVVIYWSIRSDETYSQDSPPGGGLLDTLNTLLHLPSKMRWNRLMHTVH
jgi:signal peptidase I